jgi:hypothetical protein
MHFEFQLACADQTTILRLIARFSLLLSESQSSPYTGACARRALESHVMSNNRNALYLIIGVLVVAVGVLGYNLYQAKKQPEGVQINVGPNGLKIESK